MTGAHLDVVKGVGEGVSGWCEVVGVGGSLKWDTPILQGEFLVWTSVRENCTFINVPNYKLLSNMLCPDYCVLIESFHCVLTREVSLCPE